MTFEPVRFATDVASDAISGELREFLTIYTASQYADGEPRELTEDGIYRYLDKLDATQAFAVRDEGEIVAAVLVDMRASDKMAWLAGIAVEREYRGCGIGKFAIRHLVEAAAEAGCTKLSGLAQPSESTLGFYRGLGFYDDGAIGTDKEYDGLVPMSIDLPELG